MKVSHERNEFNVDTGPTFFVSTVKTRNDLVGILKKIEHQVLLYVG